MSGLRMDIKVEGLAEMFRDLGRIDPELRKAAVRRVYDAGKMIQADARSRIPTTPPMSGWSRRRGQRGKWNWSPRQSRSRIRLKVSTGTAKRDEIRLLRVIQSDAAGSIYDMAGRKTSGRTPNGQQFIRNLNRRGRASRTLWPAAEARSRDVERALTQAVDDMADTINRRMR